MKRPLRIFVVGVAISILGFFAYARRFQLAADIWHWRYGHSVALRDYQVLVPDGWLVRDQTERGVTMTLTRGIRSSDPFWDINSISVSSPSAGNTHLIEWKSYQQQHLQNQGVTDVEERTLQAGDDMIVCVGGTELRDVLHVPSGAISVQCISSGKLDALFVGQKTELEQFYTVVSQIRKSASGAAPYEAPRETRRSPTP